MMIFYIRRMIIFIFLFFQILKSIEAKTDQTLQRHFHDHHLTQLSFPSACDAISKYLDFSSATDMDFQIIESKSDLDTCMHALRSPLTCLERHHVSNDVSHLSSQDRQRKVRIINFIRGGRSDIGDTSDTPFLKRAFQQSNAHIYGVSYVQAQLAKKLVPIRDFRRHLQASIDSPEHIPGSKYDNLSDENLYLIYNRYINLLRDHYLHKMKSYRDRDPRAVRRRCAAILGKCQQDMKDAILPQFKDIWSYEPTLLELESDINAYIEEMSEDKPTTCNMDKTVALVGQSNTGPFCKFLANEIEEIFYEASCRQKACGDPGVSHYVTEASNLYRYRLSLYGRTIE